MTVLLFSPRPRAVEGMQIAFSIHRTLNLHLGIVLNGHKEGSIPGNVITVLPLDNELGFDECTWWQKIGLPANKKYQKKEKRWPSQVSYWYGLVSSPGTVCAVNCSSFRNSCGFQVISNHFRNAKLITIMTGFHGLLPGRCLMTFVNGWIPSICKKGLEGKLLCIADQFSLRLIKSASRPAVFHLKRQFRRGGNTLCNISHDDLPLLKWHFLVLGIQILHCNAVLYMVTQR